ncbi:hypothetical protein [Burkholderia glumae]|nr:hypothetical protein [Burkholderia glumae]
MKNSDLLWLAAGITAAPHISNAVALVTTIVLVCAAVACAAMDK